MASDGSSEQIGEQPGERFADAESDSDSGSAYQKFQKFIFLGGGGDDHFGMRTQTFENF